jgi:putative PIN family toxin of toxin-antitoxin system
MHRIVIDTNVLVAALRSRRGAANKLLSLLGSGAYEAVISVPLILEYEDALLRQLETLPYSVDEVREIIDYLCAACTPQAIYYLWRPLLRDPKDDMVLEVAVAARCDTIVTFNGRDFQGAERFGLRILTPAEFLKEIHA